MKLNFINKVYLALTFILVIAIVCRIFNYKSWDRYFYYSSVSAPATYPVHVREAYFITNDRDDNAWFNTEGVNDFKTGWGEEYSFPEANRPMRLPLQLVVQYVAYRDKKFYHDTLNLPQQQIRDMFELAIENKKTDKLYHPRGDKDGLRFVLGIADDGNILLWLRGIGWEQVILKTKLTAIEPTTDDTYYGKKLSREEYIKEVFGRLSDSLKNVLDNGLEAGANYADSATHYLDRKE